MAEDDQSAGAQTPAAQGGDMRTGHLSIQKVYVKDLSFEAPNAPAIFGEQWQPSVDIQLASNAQRIEDEVHEVVVTVTVTVRFDDKTVYLVEVQQAGLFQISGFPDQHLAAMLATVCPNILFPFAREAIADTVSKGGFPQMLLAPVNFEQLYAQELQRRREAGQGDGGAGH